VRIESGERGDLEPPTGDDLNLGERIDLEAAQAAVDFDIVVPVLPDLGAPDQVYLDAVAPRDMVSLVYGERPGFELAETADVSVLITQFSAPLMRTEDFFKKLGGMGAIVDHVEVNGNEGYWMTGEPHFFYYEESPGSIAEESVRLVENVLLWEQEGVTLRIETTGSLDQALAIAAGLS
jgi:hypothetical protein